MDDQEPSWLRQLTIGIVALLVVGVLIGGVLAVVAIRAADYAGVGTNSSPSTPESILPTTGGATNQAGPPTPASTKQTHTTKPSPRFAIRLSASPSSVSSYQKINLTGSYPGHDGTTLQVQRSIGSGAWSDFPTTTHVSAGRFATYVETGMTGVNHFRMRDSSTGRVSNAVTVQVG